MILNLSNLTSGNPVDITVSGGSIVDSFFSVLNLEGEVGRFEFLLGQVEELGNTESTSGIVLDGFEVFSENFNSVSFSVGVGELLAVGLLELLPLLDDFFGDVDIIGDSLVGDQEEGSTQ